MTTHELNTGWAKALQVRLTATVDDNGRWLGQAINTDGQEIWNSSYSRVSEASIRTAFNTWARNTFGAPLQELMLTKQAPVRPAVHSEQEQGSSIGLVDRLALLVSSLDVQSIRISALIDKADMIFDRAERVLKELS